MPTKIPTIVYVDGYNLYYGRLRNNPQNYKWLDIFKLFENIIKIQSPNSEIVKLKYFTAPALGKFASHGNLSAEAQQAYWRALTILYPDQIEIIQGTQSCAPKPLPAHDADKPFNKQERRWVWVLEEKMTDVEIALAMYKDVLQNQCQQVVLCSNDSDMQPALASIRTDSPETQIGLVLPIKDSKTRRASASLEQLSHWTRHHIRDEELEHALLPDKIPTKKKPILKPAYW